MEYRILRRTEVLFMTGLATSTLYEMMEKGEFPKPIKLGRRAVGWREPIDGLDGGREVAAREKGGCGE